MLEKLGVTLGVLTLATGWVGGLAWVHGVPSGEVSSVNQPTRVAVAPGVHGYGNATSRPAPTAAPKAASKRVKTAPVRERPKPRPRRATTVPAPVIDAFPDPFVSDPSASDSLPEQYPLDPGTGSGAHTATSPSSGGGQSGGQPGSPAEFNVATFNVLGSSHTRPGGHHAWLASGPQRIGGVLQILGQHDVSVAGLQEFQGDQRAAFKSRATGWQMYPTLSMPARDGENTVAWRTDTWELVRPATVAIPYFNGRTRQMPYVLLKHRQSGLRAYFSTFHNPADTRKYRGQQRFRNAATQREIALFNRLEGEGVPQFVTGDMNERAEYFCAVTARTSLVAAAGGSNSGGCRPPKPTQIDWIFGSKGVQFSNYRVDRSPLVRRTTDHPVIVARAKVDPSRFASAGAPRG